MTRPITYSTDANPPASNATPRISSFDQKPASSGNPAIASVAMPMVAAVTGMCLRSPPIFIMSCSSAMPWMTEPEPRKSRALKKAWVIRWKIPAT